MKNIKIFIASPGDVNNERMILAETVVPELRRIFSNPQMFDSERAVELEAVRWETNAWPAVGEDAQQIINEEVGEYDILVGIMWRRFGTPTKRAGSGTAEEFERAYEYFSIYKRPYIMFYFRTSPFYTTNAKEIAQFQRVTRFRGKLEERGVLFWEYGDVLDFERRVREHLIRQVAQLLPKSVVASGRTRPAIEGGKTEKLVSERMLRLFFSYSVADIRVVRKIYESMRKQGYQVWIDINSLLPGQDWEQLVRAEIRRSDCILVFISKASVRKAGIFHKEVKWIVEDARTSAHPAVIPVRLDSARPPTSLSKYTCIDYFSKDGPRRLKTTLFDLWQRLLTQERGHNSGTP